MAPTWRLPLSVAPQSRRSTLGHKQKWNLLTRFSAFQTSEFMLTGVLTPLSHAADLLSPPRGVLARHLACLIAALAGGLGSLPARAQSITPPNYTPADPPATVHTATTGALLDIGTRFLRRLADESQTGFGSNRGDAQGGGDDVAQVVRRYRAWSEGYGQWARNDGTATIAPDTRQTYGAVGGFGITLAPGASIGFAVDQSWTRVNIDSLGQTGRLNLTQLALQGTYEIGPWTFSAAGIHAFGDVRSSRATNTAAFATTDYGARLSGAIAEASYYWSKGNWRFVPKVGMDWTEVHSDGFAEIGGNDPVTASDGHRSRWRAFGGAEAGYSWWQGRTLYDLSAYARGVDVLAQPFRTPSFSSPSTLGTVQVLEGLQEARFGFDAGASANVRISNALRFYANYDGRFRHNAQSHGATLGVEVKW